MVPRGSELAFSSGADYRFSIGVSVDMAGHTQGILEQRVAPTMAVGASPAGRALVGFESWFWVAGYDGAPRVEAFDVFGRRLVLELRPAAVRWDFGDGSRASLGPADGFGAPGARSATAHRYRVRSTSAASLAWLVIGHDAARQALKDARFSKDMLAALDADPDVVDEGLPGPAFAPFSSIRSRALSALSSVFWIELGCE